MSKGRRYDAEPKLNIKKVIAVAMAFAVIIMFIIGIKTLLTNNTKEEKFGTTNYYPVFSNDKWGVINQKGNIVIEPQMDQMITIPNSKQDIFICMQDVNYDENTYKTKVLNAKGKEIFTNYDLVEAIENIDKSNNMWYEEGALRVKKEDKYGLIDFSGKEILKPEYQEIIALQGTKNSLLIKKDEKVGLCDNKGNIIINPEYKQIKSIDNNYQNGYIVVNQDNKYGMIDFNSSTILEAEYEEIKPVIGSNIYIVKQEGKLKAINGQKEVLVENKFDDVKQIINDNLVIVKNNQYGVITKAGEEIIKPQYEELKFLFSSYYLAKAGGKYGVIDSENQKILAFEYANISYNEEGNFIIADKQDKANSEIYNEKFEKQLEGIISDIDTQKGHFRIYIENEYKYYNFKFEEKTPQEVLASDLFLSKKDGKYGYVDKEGNVKVDYKYDDATEFNTYGYAAIKKDGKWGAIDKTGAVVLEPTYELSSNVIIDFIGKWHLAQDVNSYYYTDI